MAVLAGLLPLVLVGLGILLVISLRNPVRFVPLILVCVIALCPFAGNLSGETETNQTLVVFSFSDLLFFAALPGAFRLFYQNRPRLLAALPRVAWQYGLWSLIFIGICTLSFALNRHAMTQGMLAYAAGGVRVVQILWLLPLAFWVVSWDRQTLREMWSGYLGTAAVFSIAVIALYLVGLGKIPVYAVHKNAVGLIILTGVLIALVSRWSSAANRLVPVQISNLILFLGMPALAASSSRNSVLCFLLGLIVLSVRYRKVKLPLVLTVTLLVCLQMGARIMPDRVYGVDTTISLQDRSVQLRMKQYQAALKRFKQSPLIGDGLRSRKDFQPHNLEIVLLAETGILGLVAFGGVVLSQFALFRHAAKTLSGDDSIQSSLWALGICSTMVLFHAQFDPFWRRGPLFLMAASVGIFCSLLRENNSAENE